MHRRVLAVVPAYEEHGLIGETLRALMGIDLVEKVLVIDDASRDDTARVASASGVRVVVNGRNLGKGKSLNRVIEHLDFDVLLLVDGDLGVYSGEAESILKPVLAERADLAIAAFPPPEKKGGFGLAQGLGRLGIKFLSGVEFRSPLSGQRAMNRNLFDQVSPFDDGFGVEVGMTVDALRSGSTVVEVDTCMSHRETGRDLAGFVHRGNQFRDICKALLRRLLLSIKRKDGEC